jgi:hypothetical protein
MTPPLWVVEAAERFWRDAGMAADVHPRDLKRAICYSLNFFVFELPALSLFKIRDTLSRRNIHVPLDTTDRPLRGCLVAREGMGFAFVEALDPPEEKRFTLAHELAHFLRDHRHDRERAERLLGSRGVAILDGKRPPSGDDELQAILRGVWLRPNVRLLERGDGQLFEIDRIENDADRLALEILAPFRAVREILRHFSRSEVVPELTARFGLPRWAAEAFARADDVVESPRLRRLKECLDRSKE